MKSSQDFENNKPTGLHTFWFDNGTKRAEINYEDGRRDGEFTFWHSNGQIKFQGNYLSGQVVDTWTLWYPNGQIYKETNTIRCTIYSSKPKGTRVYWYDNGQIKSKQWHTSDFNEYKSVDVDYHIIDVLKYLKKFMLEKMS
jgi:antitoxin component YwqK of YwqJK toxin-antitoxin module